MKQLVFRLAWARFRTNPEIHFDKHLRDCWTLSKQTKKAKKHHLPDKGRSAKHSSVYRQEKKNGSYQVLGGTKSEIKVANRIANRRKVSGAPVGMYSPQRLVGDLSRTNFKIQ